MSIAQSYDQTPYTTYAYRETDPAHLEGIAWLHGIAAPAVANASVLEIGCATGGNLLAMAARHPDARFIGIDISPRQIEAARAAAGVRTNVEFKAGDIVALGDELPAFDYIVCHGVLSWIPPSAREGIFRLCHDKLTPNGAAYISFNTYPGWHTRLALREAMVYHAGNNVAEARAFAALLAHAPAMPRSSLQLVKGIVGHTQEQSDDHFLHDYLEDENHPIYFHQFASDLERHGLQYVADARSNGSSYEDANPAIKALLDDVRNDVVRFEQYIDFLRDRTFRRAIICRAGLAVDRGQIVARLARMDVISLLKAEGAAFRNTHGQVVNVSEPILHAALQKLAAAFPSALPFGQVCPAPAFAALAHSMFDLWQANLIELRRPASK